MYQFGLILLLTLLVHHSYAQSTITLATEAKRFGYSEFDVDGTLLDRETGFIPGLRLHYLSKFKDNWLTDINFSYFNGQVEYNGLTQPSRNQHKTDTNTTLSNFGFQVSRMLRHSGKKTQQFMYLSSSYQQWERDILDRNNVSGLSESYRWWEGVMGYRYHYLNTYDHTWAIDVGLLRIFNPQMKVNLTSIGSPTLQLGEHFGGRLKVIWSIQIDSHWDIDITSYIEAWKFGRSNMLTIVNSSGANAGTVVEPRSETRNAGIYFSLNKNL